MISAIIKELQSDNSSNFKRSVMLREQGNEVLREAMRMTKSSRINYFIRVDKKTLPSHSGGSGVIGLSLLADVLDNLDGRKVTGNAAREYLSSVLETLHSDEQIVLANLINRDLECKVSTNIINDTWPELIPETPQMLAHPFKKKFIDKMIAHEGPNKFIVQKKEDGGRGQFIVEFDGTVTCVSRNGNELLLFGAFDETFKNHRGMVFDGELLYRGIPVIDVLTGKKSYSETADRKTGNGLFNKAVRQTISKEEADGLMFVAWDVIGLEAWRNGHEATKYSHRLAKLTELMKDQPEDKVKIIDSEYCSSIEEARVFYRKQRNKKFEGAVLKLADMEWVDDRSENQLKMKAILDGTLRCTGWIPHRKKEGQIGSLILETDAGDLEVSTGSGLVDEDRLRDPSYFIGKLIDIEFNEVIKGKGNAKHSLFLPIFNKIRTDKDKSDTLEYLQGLK